MSTMKTNEQLHKTEEQTEKSHRQGQKWQPYAIRWNQGTSKNRTLRSNVLQGEELVWKENHEIQNIAIEEPKGNVIADKRQVLKIWNYVTEL